MAGSGFDAMDQRLKEYHDALQSLDKDKILAYLRKYTGLTDDTVDESFWAAVHQCRIELKTLSEADREFSRKWLAHRGYKPAISN